MTPEGEVKEEIKNLLEEQGVFPFKQAIRLTKKGVPISGYYTMPSSSGYGEAGIGDFLCCWGGRYLEIEAKTENGKVSAIQKLHGQVIDNAGGVYLVVVGQQGVQELRDLMLLANAESDKQLLDELGALSFDGVKVH